MLILDSGRKMILRRWSASDVGRMAAGRSGEPDLPTHPGRSMPEIDRLIAVVDEGLSTALTRLARTVTMLRSGRCTHWVG